jgi:hypothetical protein
LTRDWRSSAAVGLLLGSACLFSLQALPVAAVIFGVWALGSDGPASVARRATVVSASGALMAILVAAWLVAGGAMGYAVDQLVTYNRIYASHGGDDSPRLILAAVPLAGVLSLAAISVTRMVRRPRTFDRLAWSCLAWSVAYGSYLALQERLFWHYLILLIPPLVVLAASGQRWLLGLVRRSDGWQWIGATSLGLLTFTGLLFSYVMVALIGITALGVADKHRIVETELAHWIDVNTPISATVFEWGSDTPFYLAAVRSPYDAYVYLFPMSVGDYWTADRSAGLLASWAQSPPSVILECSSAVPLLHEPEELNRSDVGTLQLREFVRSHYHLVVTFGDEATYHDVYILDSGG